MPTVRSVAGALEVVETPARGRRRAARRWFRWAMRRMPKSQARRLVPGVNEGRAPSARAVVSRAKSVASSSSRASDRANRCSFDCRSRSRRPSFHRRSGPRPRVAPGPAGDRDVCHDPVTLYGIGPSGRDAEDARANRVDHCLVVGVDGDVGRGGLLTFPGRESGRAQSTWTPARPPRRNRAVSPDRHNTEEAHLFRCRRRVPPRPPPPGPIRDARHGCRSAPPAYNCLQYHLAVIGGGSAGLAAATFAAGVGARRSGRGRPPGQRLRRSWRGRVGERRGAAG